MAPPSSKWIYKEIILPPKYIHSILSILYYKYFQVQYSKNVQIHYLGLSRYDRCLLKWIFDQAAAWKPFDKGSTYKLAKITNAPSAVPTESLQQMHQNYLQ